MLCVAVFNIGQHSNIVGCKASLPLHKCTYPCNAMCIYIIPVLYILMPLTVLSNEGTIDHLHLAASPSLMVMAMMGYICVPAPTHDQPGILLS